MTGHKLNEGLSLKLVSFVVYLRDNAGFLLLIRIFL